MSAIALHRPLCHPLRLQWHLDPRATPIQSLVGSCEENLAAAQMGKGIDSEEKERGRGADTKRHGEAKGLEARASHEPLGLGQARVSVSCAADKAQP
uniref:Uncharacterized protein n=1 Tax=Tetraselmis sp. GSL018 TaxID=582737 RepID=A0A061QW29_9CHLO